MTLHKYYGFDVKYPGYNAFVELGQKVYMCFGFNYAFVTETYVNEVYLVLHKKGTEDSAYESRYFAIGGGYDPDDDVTKMPENPDEWEIVNHWYWIDEPLAGHAIYDHDDGVYVTLQEALSHARIWKSCRKHHVRKMLRIHRERWIKGSRKDLGETASWSPIPKKIWVRRK